MDSKEYYNSLAGKYEDIFKQRIQYHAAIDNCIKSNKNYFFWKNVLDIGSGKGKRITELFRGHDARLTCVENSSEMAKELRNQVRISAVLEEDFCRLNPAAFKDQFDLVLLQWNVIGHLADIDAAIKIVSSVVRPGGNLIFDFNNPYNINQYGLRSVGNNFLHFARSKGRNNLSFPIIHKESKTKTKFFRPRYIRTLLSSHGFKIDKVSYLNYRTGKASNFLSGQILIEATFVK